MPRSEKDLLKAMSAEWAETEKLFSRAGKPLQERTAVHGLLRVLGIVHTAEEIIKQGPEPIDVWFQDARFQITEIMYPQRARDKEIRESAQRATKAQSLRDLWEPGTITSTPMEPQAVVNLVVERASEKARHYSGQCMNIDLLVYLNLRRYHLYPIRPFPPVPELEALCWRSVSLIMERFAIVLSAADSAPKFLRDRVGEGVEWPRLDSVFDWGEG